ncbi:MAG: hypothetical protein Q7S21_07375 [archaeon]|nr:hypothetical protein [archaeon]
MKKLILFLAVFLMLSFVQAGTGSFHWQALGNVAMDGTIQSTNPSIGVGCEQISDGTACVSLTKKYLGNFDSRDSLHAVFESSGKIYYSNFNWTNNSWRTPIIISGSIANASTPSIAVGEDNKPYATFVGGSTPTKEIYFNSCAGTTTIECSSIANWLPAPENVSLTATADSFSSKIDIGPNLIPIIVWVDGTHQDDITGGGTYPNGNCTSENPVGTEQTQIHVKKRINLATWGDMKGRLSTETCGGGAGILSTYSCDGWLQEYPMNKTYIYNSDTNQAEIDSLNLGDFQRCNKLYAKKIPDIDVNKSNTVNIVFENERLGAPLDSWTVHAEWNSTNQYWAGFTETIPPIAIPQVQDIFYDYADAVQIGSPVVATSIDSNSSGHIFVGVLRTNAFPQTCINSGDPGNWTDTTDYDWLVRASQPGFNPNLPIGQRWDAFRAYLPNFEGTVECFYNNQIQQNNFRLLDTKISPNNSRTENPNHVYYSIFEKETAIQSGFDGIVREWDGHKKFNSLNKQYNTIEPLTSMDILTTSLGIGQTDGNVFLIFGLDKANDDINVTKWNKDLDSAKWIQAEDFLSIAPPGLPNVPGYTFNPCYAEDYNCSFNPITEPASTCNGINYPVQIKPTCSQTPFNLQTTDTPITTLCYQATNDKLTGFDSITTQNVDRAYCSIVEPFATVIPLSIQPGEYYFSMNIGYPKFDIGNGDEGVRNYLVRIWGDNSSILMLIPTDPAPNIITGIQQKFFSFTIPDFKVAVSTNSYVSFEATDNSVLIDRFRFDSVKPEFTEGYFTFPNFGIKNVSTNTPVVVGQDIDFSIEWQKNLFEDLTIYVCSKNDLTECKNNTLGIFYPTDELYCDPITAGSSGVDTGTSNCQFTTNEAKAHDYFIFGCTITSGLEYCTSPAIGSFKVRGEGDLDVDILAVLNVKLDPNQSTYSFDDSINVKDSEIKNYEPTAKTADITITLFNPSTGIVIEKKVFASQTIPIGTTTIGNILGTDIIFDLTSYDSPPLTEDLHSIRISLSPAPGENVLGNNSKTAQFALTRTGGPRPVAVPETNILLLPIILAIVLLIVNSNHFFKNRS